MTLKTQNTEPPFRRAHLPGTLEEFMNFSCSGIFCVQGVEVFSPSSDVHDLEHATKSSVSESDRAHPCRRRRTIFGGLYNIFI
jgi:hypothetical protein